MSMREIMLVREVLVMINGVGEDVAVRRDGLVRLSGHDLSTAQVRVPISESTSVNQSQDLCPKLGTYDVHLPEPSMIIDTVRIPAGKTPTVLNEETMPT